VAAAAAEIREQPCDLLAAITTQNARRLFLGA
jgi:Tat protein secretion system quality control protein TatD with DNase activity